ncbi:MAG: putative phosphoglycerate mutase [Rhodoferax sp.]|jgi:probable phosphoglycerate mutase
MTELILIRHGETDWNRELRFQGQVDVPLNAIGHEQAHRLGVRLAGEAAHLLVCSDLIRAQQTALPIGQLSLPAYACNMLLAPALREQDFGLVDGLQASEIQTRYPVAWAQWLRFEADSAFEGGESRLQLHARVMDAVQTLVRAHPLQTLVVVTHGGVLDMIYRSARGMPLSGPRQSEIPNAGLSRVRITGERMDILSWADTQHLSDMPPQPRYDQVHAAASE